MNGTSIPSTQANPQEQNTGGLGYGLALSVAILLFVIIVTYCSYVSTRARSPLSFSYPNYSITVVTTTTIENDGISPRQGGIDENTLKQYPKFLYSGSNGPTSSGCSICLSDYKDRDTIRMLPECGHIFHLSCIDPWLRMNSTCPICRTTPLATPLAEVVS